MPATFATELCGFRDGRPNTSDKNDRLSIELGEALFAELDVPYDASPPTDVGNEMSAAVSSDLRSRRPDLGIAINQPAYEFGQYQHLGALVELKRRRSRGIGERLASLLEQIDDERARDALTAAGARRLRTRVEKLQTVADEADRDLKLLVEQLGTESLLRIDVAVSESQAQNRHPDLLIGIDDAICPPEAELAKSSCEVLHGPSAIELQHERDVLKEQPQRFFGHPANQTEDLFDQRGVPSTNASSASGLAQVLTREASRHNVGGGQCFDVANVGCQGHARKPACKNSRGGFVDFTHELRLVAGALET
jgi:hypothetical protein